LDFFSGTNGCVVYPLSTEHDPFVITWEVPWLGATKSSNTCSEHYKMNIEENPVQNFVIYTIIDEHQKLNNRQVVMPPVIYETWKVQLKRARRSMQVRINNTTNITLKLQSSIIEHGLWRLEPPNEILPGAEVDFGSESFGIGGTTGKIIFSLKGNQENETNGENSVPITFAWNIGLIGPPLYESNVFSIETVVVGNHTELILQFASDELYVASTSSVAQDHNTINEKTQYLFHDDDFFDDLEISSDDNEGNDIELMSNDKEVSSLEEMDEKKEIKNEENNIESSQEEKNPIESDSDDLLGKA